MEQCEDRVLLSISPGGDDAMWDRALVRAIERASDVSRYDAEATDRWDESRQWMVSLAEGTDGDQMAARVAASPLHALDYFEGGYVWQFASGIGLAEAASNLHTLDGIEFSYPLVPQVRETRAVPDDTQFVDQWHLENTGQTGGTAGADANVVDVWDQYRGTGVVIGIVDDGIDHQHEDLQANYDATLSYDYRDSDSDPQHTDPADAHGTSVAGVAAAVGNNTLGVSGSAPDATLAGLRLIGAGATDVQEAGALAHANQQIDIYSNSWGPPDGYGIVEGPDPLTMMAIQDGVLNGRGGLGNLYTWAGGNGGLYEDNVNYDGYANSRFTIAVGAIDHNGQQSYYSEPGAPLLVSAYSSGAGVGITTTDRTGADGYDTGNYTSTFGGTSSATPLVSGVLALMLEANPNLTYRDVQHILVESAETNDASDVDWTTNAAGYSINHNYGFGAIDAEAAVSEAETWETVDPEISLGSGIVPAGLSVPDNSTTGVASIATMGNEVGTIEWVEVTLDIDHTWDADLEVVLISPGGTESILAEPHFDFFGGTDFDQWTFTSARHWGESSGGDWVLLVRDLVSADVGTLNSWELNLYGMENRGAGPELIAVIPNVGDTLDDGEVMHVAPRELTFRFNRGQEIDPSTLGAIQIIRSGGDGVFGNADDVVVEYGWIGIGEQPNEVIVRFAEPLPDDLYQIIILGTGVAPLTNIAEIPFQYDSDLDGGEDLIMGFELDLGAQVTAVVPQPIARDASGALVQYREVIEVYFSDDDLAIASAENPDFYQLIVTNETADTNGDLEIAPILAEYDSVADKVTLTFADPLEDYGHGALRLRVGNRLQQIITSRIDPSADAASTFAGANTDLGVLGSGVRGESVVIGGAISPEIYTIEWPGSNDEPGHRDFPFVSGMASEEHLGEPGDTTTAPVEVTFAFPDDLGGGFFNVITEEQKVRAREIIELFQSYWGVRFSEMEDDGLGGSDLTIATGNLEALGMISGKGGVAGLGGGFQFAGIALMDAADFETGSEQFGGGWFNVAMHEIMHAGELMHTYDLPPMTVMGSGEGGTFYPDIYESIFPSPNDNVHAQHLYRPDSTDIDMYQFDVDRSGVFSAETFAERLEGRDSSLLDSMITLYQHDPTDPKVPWKKIGRNDDSFSEDAYLELSLEPGTYSVAVTASGNFDFDPTIANSGIGGMSFGDYELRVTFRPEGDEHLSDATGTLFDGDSDGVPGGVYDFWFNAQDVSRTIIVDKSNTGAEDGSLAHPYNSIPEAFAEARSIVAADYVAGTVPENVEGVLVRVVGNNFANDDPTDPVSYQDNIAYELGRGLLGNTLSDGSKLEVPHKTTLMIDAGSVFKLRGANLDSGSSAQGVDRSEGYIQVLGTPEHSVFLTSYHDESLGTDTEMLTTVPDEGDWGGIIFRNNRDYDDQARMADTDGERRVLETEGIFINYVNHADIRYGGGRVNVNGLPKNFTPVHMMESRPTVSYNVITESAAAAMSADANSFLESKFQGNLFGSLYTADYDRVGPDIHNNRLAAHYEGEDTSLPKHLNSLNALFVGIATDPGKPTDTLEVAGRFDDWDIVHAIRQNLQIRGTPGGPVVLRDTLERISREDGRLMIDPGIIVKLEGTRIEAQIGAQLIAEGTDSYPIIFTSTQDDRYGAGGTFDTTENASQRLPLPGDWGGIYIGPVARGSIDRARVFFAGGTTPIEGGFGEFDTIESRQGILRVTNTLFEFNSAAWTGDRNGRGWVNQATIHVRGSQPVIAGNVFRNNTGAMISIDAGSMSAPVMTDWGRSTGGIDTFELYADNHGPLVRENRAFNNAVNGMVVRGMTLQTETIWDDTDIVHVVFDEIVVPNHHHASGVRLQSNVGESLVVKLRTDDAGFTAAGRPLAIDDRIGGTVQVVGTPGFPVVLTSLADDTFGAGFDPWDHPLFDTDNTVAVPQPGDWRSIKLDRYANDRNVAIVNEIEDAFGSTVDANATPETAQYLGNITPEFMIDDFGKLQHLTPTQAGDERLRLGFEIEGSIRLDDPTDVDVYLFEATAGTKVWVDLDNTRFALDTIVELVNVDGDVLATSDDSRTELNSDPVGTNLARMLDDDAWATKDHNTINPRDAGFNIILPGPRGEPQVYYVRVRSAPATPAADPMNPDITAGITRGAYQIQLRLTDTQEIPGSLIKHADIRFAKTGVETVGLPYHSPLLIESIEEERLGGVSGVNDTFATAQDLGNLLISDRNTITVGGFIEDGDDIDWYKFDVGFDGIQSIPGVTSDASGRFPIMFDVDYAYGLGRPDVQIWVFDSAGRLLLHSDDTNIVDDKPGPHEGANVDNLQRGSFSDWDPFIGSLPFPEGGESYYVAVTTFRKTAAALGQSLMRTEPIDTVMRVVEDHIGNTVLPLDIARQDPVTGEIYIDEFGADTADVLFEGSGTGLNVYAEEYHVGDVVMYVSIDDDLYTINPFTGAFMTDVTTPDSPAGPQRLPDTQPALGEVGVSYGDIAMRNDGRLYSFTRAPTEPDVNRNAWAGRYRQLNTGDARNLVSDVNDGIVTYRLDPTDPKGLKLEELGDTQVGTANFPLEPGGISFEAMAHGYDNRTRSAQNIARERGVLAVGSIMGQSPNASYMVGMPVENLLYLLDSQGRGLDQYNIVNDGRNRIPSNVLPLAKLWTASTLVVPEYGTTDDSFPFSQDLLDAARFTIPDQDGTPLELVFEFDCGPDIRMSNDGPKDVRDGESFMLDDGAGPVVFEFNSGPVIVLDKLAPGFAFQDGDAFTIQDIPPLPPPGQPRAAVQTKTFEFEDVSVAKPDGVVGNNVAINYTPNMSALNLVQVVVDAINGAGFATVAAGHAPSTTEARISLVEDANIQPSVGATTFELQGDYTQLTANPPDEFYELIQFEETMLEDYFGNGGYVLPSGKIYDGIVATVLTEMPNLSPGFGHRTAGPNNQDLGDRLTFFNAVDSAFAPTGGWLRIDAPGENNALVVTGDTIGVALNGVEVVLANNVVGNDAIVTWDGLVMRLTIDIDPTTTTADMVVQRINEANLDPINPVPFTAVVDTTDATVLPSDGSGNMFLAPGLHGITGGGIVGVPSFTHVNGQQGQLSAQGIDQAAADIQVPFGAGDDAATLTTTITDVINDAHLFFPEFGVVAAASAQSISLSGVPTGIPPVTVDAPIVSKGEGNSDGLVSGMAWLNNRLYVVDDKGGFFELVDPDRTEWYPDPPINVKVDPPVPDLSQRFGTGARLRWIATLTKDVFDSTKSIEGIQFGGLCLGPQNVEGGAYSDIFYAVSKDGRLYAFDVNGVPQPVFLNGENSVDILTEDGGLLEDVIDVRDFTGVDFSTLDYNLWHVTDYRKGDRGHGVEQTFTNSRIHSNGYGKTLGDFMPGETSFYFGLENPQPGTTITNQPDADNYLFTNSGIYYSYDLPGGAHGVLTTEPFSLIGYAGADQPRLYFNYWAETDGGAYTDAVRVFGSTDGANWDMLASSTDRTDPFVRGSFNPNTGGNWRQASIGMSAYAGLDNIQLRFQFDTASNLNIGDRYADMVDIDGLLRFDTTGELNGGALLRAVPGEQIIDGQVMNVDGDLDYFGFQGGGFNLEFDLGLGLIIPNVAGRAMADGEHISFGDRDGDNVTIEFENPDAANYVPGPGLASVELMTIGFADSTADVANRLAALINDPAFAAAWNLDGLVATVQANRVLIGEAVGGGDPSTTSTIIWDDPNSAASQPTGASFVLGVGVAAGNVPVSVTPNMTAEQVAETVATALDQLFSNSRLLLAADGAGVFDGNSFSLSDGYQTVVFEFENSRLNDGVAPGAVAVPYDPGDPLANPIIFPDSAASVALSIAAAINGAGMRITATTNAGQVVLAGPWVTWDLAQAGFAVTVVGTIDDPNLYTSVKLDGDLIHMIGHGVPVKLDPTSMFETIPLSGPMAYSSFLPGDYRFVGPQAWFANAEFYNISRGANNRNEGFYIDDIILGFTERGELYTNSTPNTDFNTRAVAVIENGHYQLEIRRGDEVGVWPSPFYLPEPGVLVNPEYDTNDRIRQGITLLAPSVEELEHEETFSISDGATVVTFQYIGENIGGGDPAFTQILFAGEETGGEIAEMIVVAINDLYDRGVFRVSAANTSTSNRVDLFGATRVDDMAPARVIIFDLLGDQNLLHRDQGQTIIESTRVTNSSEWGIYVGPGAVDPGSNRHHTSPPATLRIVNNQGLVPGILLQNNVTAFNGSGGIYVGGEAIDSRMSASPFVKVVNNTVWGDADVGGTSVGIEVGPNAAPTLLNNVVANTAVGVLVDGTSRNKTVLGGMAFQDNLQNTSGVGLGDFPMLLASGEPLFVDPSSGNFYPNVGSLIIDSSIDALEERPVMKSIHAPLGIPESPILAPNGDLFGQLRRDDPSVSPPSGIGANVYKDRGAIDRVDFYAPDAELIVPLDNDADFKDRNRADDDVFIAGERLPRFSVQLLDTGGVGINDATVTTSHVEVWRDGTLLTDGLDYYFEYNSTNDTIHLFPAPGVWFAGHVYTIELDNQGIRDLANNALKPNRTDAGTRFIISLAGLDFGDAPDPYPSPLAVNGAQHVISGAYLGSGVTSESDARVNSNDALGDTLDDGVTFDSALLRDSTTTVRITASDTGRLDAWIDFNDDGVWATPEEKIFDSFLLNPGENVLTVDTPVAATLGTTYARFRFSQAGGLSPTGESPDGEVEDYQVRVVEFFEDFGDAPDQYSTTLARAGARHAQVTVGGGYLYLGADVPDYEADGLASLDATGDDTTGVDDEDGVVFVDALVPGDLVDVDVTASQDGGLLQGWIDFDGSGAWAAGEQIFTDQPISAGLTTLSFAVPDTAIPGMTFARFRVSTQAGLLPIGPAVDGEVEDYRVSVIEFAEDYGDAPDPYPTLRASDGARHTVVNGFSLGSEVDVDFDGLPNATATGDDLDNTADEDGVVFDAGSLFSGTTTTVTVNVTNTAGIAESYLDGWIDYNADGDWADQGEHVFSQLVTVGQNVLSLDVPQVIAASVSFARFRLSADATLGLTPTTPFDDVSPPIGEVEDYQITMNAGSGEIYGRKFNDLNANGLFDFGEPGLPGVTVYLDENMNGQLDAGEPSAVTAVDDLATPQNELGTYSFTALFDDIYFVREDLGASAAEWVSTYPNQEATVNVPSGDLVAIQCIEGLLLLDSTLFEITDGTETILFEFEDVTLGAGDGVVLGHVPVDFSRTDTAEDIATRIADLLTNHPVASRLAVTSELRGDIVMLRGGAQVAFYPDDSGLTLAVSHSGIEPASGGSGGDVGYYTIVLETDATVSNIDFGNFRTPHLGVSNIDIVEGNHGETTVLVELELTGSFGAELEVFYQTQDGTAIAGAGDASVGFGNDYEGVSSSVIFQPQTAPEGAWQTVTLTQNLPNDYDYQSSGNWITWETHDGNDSEIELGRLDASGNLVELRHLTDNQTHDEKPYVSGNFVVYSGTPSLPDGSIDPLDTDLEIYVYDITTQTTYRATVNSVNDLDVKVSTAADGTSYLAWWTDSVQTDSEVFYSMIPLGGVPTLPVNLSGNTTQDFAPQLSGSRIVWHGEELALGVVEDLEIFYFDASQPGTPVQQLTSNTTDDYSVRIDGDHIVWQGGSSSDTDVFLYRLDDLIPAPINLTVGAYPSRNQHPVVSDGNIVWQGFNGWDWDIYHRHVDGASPAIISNTGYADDQYPDIEGAHVVWSSLDLYTRNHDIYYYELGSSNLPVNVSNLPDRDWKPQVTLVGQGLDAYPLISWRNYDGTDYEIVVALPGQPTATMVIELVVNGDLFIEDNESFFLDVLNGNVLVGGIPISIPVVIDGAQAEIHILNDDGALDFGDAPEGLVPWDYPTTLDHDGARHSLLQGFHLGTHIDVEPDAQSGLLANGDDLWLGDDEDGVVFGDGSSASLIPGEDARLTVTASIPAGETGLLDAWIDFNADGDWDDVIVDAASGEVYSERIFSHLLLDDPNGVNDLIVAVPESMALGATYARFRLSRAGVASYLGMAPDGEVEDYLIVVNSAPVADAGGVYQANEGSTIVLDASASYDLDGTIQLYEWDLDGDGVYETEGKVVTIAKTDSGVYDIGLRVTDAHGATDETTATVIFHNVAPTAEAGGPYTGTEGIPTTLSAVYSTDPGLDIARYDWDFDSDGSIDAQGVTATFTPTDSGTYSVTLTVTDEDGQTGIDTSTIAVLNVAPSVSTPPNVNLNEGDTYTGSITVTDPGADDVWTVVVNYGDGSPDETLTAEPGAPSTFSLSHHYLDDRTYTVLVSATDDDGGEGTADFIVAVANLDPVITLNAPPSTLIEGDIFTASGSITDVGIHDTFIGAQVDFGDGTVESITIVPDPAGGSATFTLPGHEYVNERRDVFGAIIPYEVTISVEDDDRGSDVLVHGLTVNNAPPVITLDPVTPIIEGETISGTGSFTDPGRYDIWRGEVDFGDGAPTQAVTFVLAPDGLSSSFLLIHTYSTAGDYPMTVTVWDDLDAVDVATTTVTVEVSPLVAVSGGPYVTDEGASVELDGSGSYDGGGGTISRFEWDMDNNGLYEYESIDGTATMQAKTVSGVYTVNLRVTDAVGNTDIDSTTVTFNNVAPTAVPGGPYATSEGTAITLDGSGSHDPGGDMILREWDLDNNGTYDVEGAIVSFTPTDSGLQTVAMRVEDADGAEHVATTTIDVTNLAPIVTLDSGVPLVEVVEGATLGESITVTDAGVDDTWTVVVNYGDGPDETLVTDSSLSTLVLSHVYVEDGSYTVTVTATDDDGGISVPLTFDVDVLNAAPVILLTPPVDPTIVEGSEFTATGQITDAGLLDTMVDATVDYGDGALPTALTLDLDGNFTLNRVYPNERVDLEGNVIPYPITIHVEDDDGGVSELVHALTVTNAAPVVTLEAVPDSSEGNAITLGGWFDDVGVDDTWSVEVDFGDGSAAEQISDYLPGTQGQSFAATHVYADDGDYSITVTVEDDAAATGSATTPVSIANQAPSLDGLGTIASVQVGTTWTRAGTVGDPGVNDTWGGSVNYGDGTVEELAIFSSGIFQISHTFAAPGEYTVQVQVTDYDGGTDTADIAVTAYDLQPNDNGELIIPGGQDEDDVLIITVTPTEVVLDVNGDISQFWASEVDEIFFDGQGGDDTTVINLSAEDDTIVLSPETGTISNAAMTISIVRTPHITVNGGGGNDVGILHDSAGDDHLDMSPQQAVMTGPDFVNTVTDVDWIYAGASNVEGDRGGHDTAELAGTAEREIFLSKQQPNFSQIYSAGNYIIQAANFEYVHSNGTGSNDVAKLYDSAGNDQVFLSPNQGRMEADISTVTGPGYVVEVDSYRAVQARAPGWGDGGDDTLWLTGSSENDRVVTSAKLTKITGPGRVYKILGKYFEHVHADTGAGNDSVKALDSRGNDLLRVAEDLMVLRSRASSNLSYSYRIDLSNAESGTADSRYGSDKAKVIGSVDWLLLQGAWNE